MTQEERITKLEEMQEKNQILSREILESIMGLERIIVYQTGGLMDLEKIIKFLEDRKSKG